MRTRIISPFLLTNTLVNSIRRFRGQAWGKVPAVVNGMNIHMLDAHSWHILLYACDNSLVGCARYYRGPVVELGGFALKRKGTRDVVRIINAVILLAKQLGDTRFRARASVDSGSASILQKLGGRVTSAPAFNWYYMDTSVEIAFDFLPDTRRYDLCGN